MNLRLVAIFMHNPAKPGLRGVDLKGCRDTSTLHNKYSIMNICLLYVICLQKIKNFNLGIYRAFKFDTFSMQILVVLYTKYSELPIIKKIPL